jgi:hypothetical protein
MIKFPNRIFTPLLILQLLSFNGLFANTPGVSEDDNDTANTRNLLVSFDYGSNRTFLGRSQSVNQVYASPAISYEAPSGFFTSVMAYRLLSPKNRWEEFDVNFGWGFFLFSRKLEASVAYSHYGYGKKSQQLNAPFNNNLETVLRKNFGPVKSELYVDYDFGNGNKDYSFAFNNSHDFIFENLIADDDEFKIKPLISLTAGTLNFYKLHLKNPEQKPQVQNLAATVNTTFNFTGIELSLPLEYNIGRFSLEPAIHHSIPLNQPKRLNATAVTYFTMSLSFSII